MHMQTGNSGHCNLDKRTQKKKQLQKLRTKRELEIPGEKATFPGKASVHEVRQQIGPVEGLSWSQKNKLPASFDTKADRV